MKDRFVPEYVLDVKLWYLRDTKANEFVYDEEGFGMPLAYVTEEDAKNAAYYFNFNEKHGYFPNDEDWDEV